VKSEYRGHDGVREVMAVFTETFEGYEAELHAVRDAGDCVVALIWQSSRIHQRQRERAGLQAGYPVLVHSGRLASLDRRAAFTREQRRGLRPALEPASRFGRSGVRVVTAPVRQRLRGYVRSETQAIETAVSAARAQQRVALVTGSSRGLGSAIARRLARDGLTVAVNDRHGEEAALDVVGAIHEDGGVADAFTGDVTDERQVTDLVAAVAATLGPIDVLVLNATGPQPEAPLTDVPWGDHVAQLEFFVKSPVLLGRVVIPGMQARRFGRIVQIDSEVVDRPPPGRSAYAAAKSAQIGLTRSWARELAPFGITVNTVAPGFIPVERHADVPDEIRSAYLASVPAGRIGTREDISHAVSFFASEAAGFVTGQRLVVDGGRGLSG
jgi:3-oxoacyl-[acyl-carrier protein] reductase